MHRHTWLSMHVCVYVHAHVQVTLITQNLCGFYVELDIIPPWVSWASYLSYYRYAYQAFLRTQTDPAVYSVYASTFEVVTIFALSSMVYILALVSHLAAWLSTVLQSQQRASIQLKPAETPPPPPPIPQHSSTVGPLPNLKVASAARLPAASCRENSANSEPSSCPSSVGVSVRPLEVSVCACMCACTCVCVCVCVCVHVCAPGMCACMRAPFIPLPSSHSPHPTPHRRARGRSRGRSRPKLLFRAPVDPSASH